jgi:hypothetical protein
MSFAASAEKSVFEAIKNGDVEEVKRMAKTKDTLDTRDVHGRTPLMHAAEQGNLQMATVLAEAGADINAKDKNGFTAIDLLESMLRRLNMNTPEYKQKRIEQMRREGFSEDVIRKDIQMIENPAPGLQKNADDVQKLQGVLDYLKQVKESKDKADAGREKPSAGSSSNRGALGRVGRRF